jgi:hypothetical protein
VWAYFDTTSNASIIYDGSQAHAAVSVTELPARVSLTASATQVWAGGDFTLSGDTQIQDPDGTWEPLPDATVSEPALGRTGAGSYTGTYSYTATADGTASYQVELLPDTDYDGRAWYGDAYSGTVKVITRYHTRISPASTPTVPARPARSPERSRPGTAAPGRTPAVSPSTCSTATQDPAPGTPPEPPRPAAPAASPLPGK